MKQRGLSRRDFLRGTLSSAVLAGLGLIGWKFFNQYGRKASVFVANAESYSNDLASTILSGFKELGVESKEIKDKVILLKPNLVETSIGSVHINTHPAVVSGAAEAFLKMGAKRVIVAEGAGHCRDAYRLLEESGLHNVLTQKHTSFVDLNNDDLVPTRNQGGWTSLKKLYLPATLKEADWIVSLPKLKTHHWVGITLSMKNLFGVMPGRYYGWPKNVLHQEGIGQSILDINATVKPHFAIVDGIIGMEGDGPIMGTPRKAGILVMGRNLLAVDATCARLMGISPEKVEYLAVASNRFGPIAKRRIALVGEKINKTRRPFELMDHIPAHKGLKAEC